MDHELYQEQIIDHYKNPRNKKELNNPDFIHTQHNPLCGDELTFYIKRKEDQSLEITFTGNGCAISQASASLLSEFLNNKNIEEIQKLTEEEIYTLLGIPISNNRKKCALLSLKTIKKAIEGNNNDTKN